MPHHLLAIFEAPRKPFQKLINGQEASARDAVDK